MLEQLCPYLADAASSRRMHAQGWMNALQFFASYGPLCKELGVKFRWAWSPDSPCYVLLHVTNPMCSSGEQLDWSQRILFLGTHRLTQPCAADSLGHHQHTMSWWMLWMWICF